MQNNVQCMRAINTPYINAHVNISITARTYLLLLSSTCPQENITNVFGLLESLGRISMLRMLTPVTSCLCYNASIRPRDVSVQLLNILKNTRQTRRPMYLFIFSLGGSERFPTSRKSITTIITVILSHGAADNVLLLQSDMV